MICSDGVELGFEMLKTKLEEWRTLLFQAGFWDSLDCWALDKILEIVRSKYNGSGI